MKLDNDGYSQICSFEGLSLKPYLCSAKVPTIGYGNTYYPDGKRVTLLDDEITKEYAFEIFKEVADRFAKKVDSLVTSEITQNQFNSLVSFAYNVGTGNFQSSTLLKKVNADPNDLSIKLEFAKWNKAGGKKIEGLVNRRKKEYTSYILMLIISFIFIGCSSRKVEKQKTEIATKIENKEVVKKDVEINTNVEIKENNENEFIEITPIDNTKEFIVNGKSYKNAKITKGKNKQNKIYVSSQKIKDNSKKEVEKKEQAKKATYNRHSERTGMSFMNWFWLILLLIIVIIIWFYRKKFGFIFDIFKKVV